VPASVLSVDFMKMRMSRSEAPAWTTLYSDLRTDTLYGAVGTTVLPQLTGTHQAGVWRSRRYVLNAQPSLALMLLEGPFTAAVARLYRDGALYYTTPTIAANVPVPLPATRFREIELEVESDDRITRAVLASSMSELVFA
jgi:hypothetical protein